MLRFTEAQLAEYEKRTKVAPAAVVAPEKPKAKRIPSEESLLLAAQLAPLGFVPEHRFCERRWRFDQAHVGLKIALELEGAVWTNGRHVRPQGFLNDIEKYNRASMAGWMVVRVVPDQVKSGDALETARLAIKARTK